MRRWFRWQRLRRRLPGLATSLWVIDPNGYLAGSRNLQLQGLVTPSSHAYHRSDICPGDMGIISRDIMSQLILPAARNSKESWI
jgi:hypothetical protein